MVTWGQLIWIFFPIPILCFVIQFLLPDKHGSAAVKKIFFTEISIGPIQISLLWLFIHLSLVIFAHSANKANKLQYGLMPYINYDNEGMWYHKALRYRAERNFWLSLFNAFLWFLVWKVYSLKQNIVSLTNRINVMELSSELYKGTKRSANNNTEEKNGRSKKDD